MISSFQTCKADHGIAFSETIVFIFPDFINLFHLLPFSPSSHSSITLSIPLARTFQMRMHLKPQARHSVTHSVTESQRWNFTNIPILPVVISLVYLSLISGISHAYSDISQTYLCHISGLSQPNRWHISNVSQTYVRRISDI